MRKQFSTAFIVMLTLVMVNQLLASPVEATTEVNLETSSTVTTTERKKFGEGLIKQKFAQIKEIFLYNKQERKENKEERKDDRKENREERKEDRQENREERLENVADRVEKRFAMHEEKLGAWIARAEKHVSELKAKGKDTTTAEKAIATAKTSLANAVTLGKESVVKLRAITPEAWKAQKTEVKAAREAAYKAQRAFTEVLKDIRQILVELKKLNA